MYLDGGTFIVKTMDIKSGEMVEKEATVLALLDGPGADRRTYCSVAGLQDWDVVMPLENFAKMIIREVA